MEVDCNSPRWQMKRLSRMQMEIYGGWNRFRRGITFALIRRKGEEEGGEERREGSIREHNSRKNVIPKQLVIRRSTNNRFVSRRAYNRGICTCVFARVYVPTCSSCNPTIQFSGDIITRYIIPTRVANISADHEDRFHSKRYEIKK